MGADVTSALRERLLADAGAIERVGGDAFFGLLTFESGCRIGLALGDAEQAAACWAAVSGPAMDGAAVDGAAVDGAVLTKFAESDAIKFVELIEHPRADIEARIEQAAKELELPAQSVVFSLPVVELVRAMLEKERAHFCRQCLLWLLPSELRALRAEIAAVAENELLPRQLRDLAARLVVPE